MFILTRKLNELPVIINWKKNIFLEKLVCCFGSGNCSLSFEKTSPPGSNLTNLLPWWSISGHRTGMTNVLVVTTAVRMLHRIHRNTTNLRPTVPLHSVFVVCISCLQHRLLSPSSTGHLADHSSAVTWQNLLGPRWKLNSAHDRKITINIMPEQLSLIDYSQCHENNAKGLYLSSRT